MREEVLGMRHMTILAFTISSAVDLVSSGPHEKASANRTQDQVKADRAMGDSRTIQTAVGHRCWPTLVGKELQRS